MTSSIVVVKHFSLLNRIIKMHGGYVMHRVIICSIVYSLFRFGGYYHALPNLRVKLI